MSYPFRSWLCLGVLVLAVIACGGEKEDLSSAAAMGGVTSGQGQGGAGGQGGAAAGGSGGAGGQGAGGHGGASGKTGSVIVGVTSQLTLNQMSELHVILSVNGAVVEDRTYGALFTPPIAFPLELAFSDLPDGDAIDVVVRATDPVIDEYRLILEQRASTTVVAGETLLLRVTLTHLCSPWQALPPKCDAPLTCGWGSCRDAYAPPEGLETYSPNWAMHSYCKPEMSGAPVVLLGTGPMGYMPVNDSDVLTPYAGDQGGHHVWVVLRVKNLRQTSLVTLTAFFPDPGITLGPNVFSLDFAENVAAGYCENLAIPLQLDANVDISQLLGKDMQMTAQVADEDGASAGDSKNVTIADTVIPL